MGKLGNLKPERVFYYFEELSKIPRESGNEKAVSDYLVETGKKLGLEVYQDEVLNVVMRKKATKGYENSPGVVLQGHMDMVCEKELDSNHDFLKDGIDLIVEGNLVKANKTTLGGDNGIAVAMSLALLEDETLEHPQLEFIATVEEETTMKGALSLKDNMLTGKMLLNIDSEEEGVLTAGSAGGQSILVDYLCQEEIINVEDYNFFKLEVKQLYGGHSGMEINKNRANANKVLAEILEKLSHNIDMKFYNFNGGTKDNAIPRQAFVELAILKRAREVFLNEVLKLEKDFKNKYAQEEEMEILVSDSEAKETVFTTENLKQFISLIKELPTGPYTMMEEYPEIVESSDNLAIVITEGNKININLSLRSSNPAVMKDLADKIIAAATNNGAKSTVSEGYPGWKFRKNSPLRDKAVEVWKKLYNEDMEVTVIHAGLECGAISQVYPDMDMISIGPNMYDVHTPKERMEIESIRKYYDYVRELIKALK